MTNSIPPADPTALPLYDFANKSTLVGLLQELTNSIAKNTEDMLPATVIAYDRVNNRATVQPAIHMVSQDGTLVGRAQIASVPVLALGGGGFFVNFPLVSGARGWIKACDRDISLYLQASKAAGPNGKLMHDFGNGMFIPDVVSGYTISSEDAANMLIQSIDGTVKIALGPGIINVNAAAVNINGVLTINGQAYLSHTHDNSGGDGIGGPVHE